MKRLLISSLIVLSIGSQAATLPQIDRALDVREGQANVAGIQLTKFCARLLVDITKFNAANGIGDKYNAELTAAEAKLVTARADQKTVHDIYKALFSKLHSDIGSLEAAQELAKGRNNVERVLEIETNLLDGLSDREDAIKDQIDAMGAMFEAYLKDFRNGLGGLTFEQFFIRFETYVAQYQTLHAAVLKTEKKIAQLAMDLKNFPCDAELHDRLSTYGAAVAAGRIAVTNAWKTLVASNATLRVTRHSVARLHQLMNIFGDHTLPGVCKTLLDK